MINQYIQNTIVFIAVGAAFIYVVQKYVSPIFAPAKKISKQGCVSKDCSCKK